MQTFSWWDADEVSMPREAMLGARDTCANCAQFVHGHIGVGELKWWHAMPLPAMIWGGQLDVGKASPANCKPNIWRPVLC